MSHPGVCYSMCAALEELLNSPAVSFEALLSIVSPPYNFIQSIHYYSFRIWIFWTTNYFDEENKRIENIFKDLKNKEVNQGSNPNLVSNQFSN